MSSSENALMNRNNLFTIILIVLIGGIGYMWYSSSQTPQDAPGAEEAAATFTQSIAQLERLRTIDIDTTIFQDPVFVSLEAPPVPIEAPVTPGRTNPFLKFR